MDSLDVKNRALAKLPASAIADEDEDSLEARETRRYYPAAVSSLLEGPYEWSWAKQRVTLAEAGTNDRPNEWLYAYTLPSTAASVVRVLPDLDALGIQVPVPLPGDPYAEAWAYSQLEGVETPYVLDGEIIYSNEQNAILEFIVNDIANLRVSKLVENALVDDLAAKICVPIKKDSQREQQLKADAEISLQRAIADDHNRQPDNYGCYVPETIAARHGTY